MTLEEYKGKMNEYSDKLKKTSGNEWNEIYENMTDFQRKFMKQALEDYKKTVDCEEKKCIYDLLEYVVNFSESGSSVKYVDSKEMADKIDKIIWEEIGDYLLDYQVYEENDKWAIDCMFGGYYVPEWDGWQNEEQY